MTAANSPLFTQFNGIKKIHLRFPMVLGSLLGIAVIFFEIFNYSTTQYALRDLLGDLKFAGIYWSTTLAIAFCAIDFAGIARLLTPQSNESEPKESWYLFCAWLLAASMNAGLTWWGVAMATSNHELQSSSILESSTIRTIIPIFVALMVWLIRIMIIGTIAVAGTRIFGLNQRHATSRQFNPRPTTQSLPATASFHQRTNYQTNASPASLQAVPRKSYHDASEPAYRNLSASPRSDRR